MIFSETTGLNDALYGKWQAPIMALLEQNEEACSQNSLVDKIFHVEKSTHAMESYTGLTALDDFEPVGENGAYPKGHMEQGYAKVIENVEWKRSFAISQAMVEDSKVIDMKKQPVQFVSAFYRTRERFGAAMLGGAIGGSTKVKFGGREFDASAADGLGLFSKVHKNKVSKETQSNLFSNELNADTLGLAETHMQNITGDTGEVLAVAPTTILIPNDAALKKAALQAVGSADDPAGSNHVWNYHFGRWNIYIWPYLNKYLASGVKPWMLLDEEYNELVGSLIWQDRVELTVKSVIDANDANVWKGRARFSAGFNDWRGICCGGITGGTDLS
jgi:phage major head subunit gpT-like protein